MHERNPDTGENFMNHPEKRQKRFSLNRQITKIVIAVYLLFFATIALFLTNSVLNFQEKRDEQADAMLQASADQISASIDDMEIQTLRIYNSSKDLYRMDHYVNNTVSYDSLIGLKNDLDEAHTTVGKYDSLWVFYDYFRQCLFRTYESKNVDEVEGMKADCRTFLNSEGDDYGSCLLAYPEHIYYAVYYRRDRIAAAGLTELVSRLPSGGEYRFGIVSDGHIYAVGEAPPFYATELNAAGAGPAALNGSLVYSCADAQHELAVVAWREDTLFAHIRPVQLLAFAALFLTIVPMSAFLRLIHRRLILPLRNMTDAMCRIQEGRFESFQADTNVEEIEEVKKSIQTMTKEILNWQQRTYEEKMERQAIQMQYLKLQLGPHFYLNCLKNASAALMVRKYDYVQEYLYQVSDHLRYLMRDYMDFVTAGEELVFVGNYVRMMRCGDQCSIMAEKESGDCLIPALAIQLFVENSVKYACSDSAKLHIDIAVKRLSAEEGEYLDIVVQDNGCGYPKEMLDALNAPVIPKLTEHVGIINLRQRLRLLYGDRAQCFFENQGGAVSNLLLPYRRKEEDGESSDR